MADAGKAVRADRLSRFTKRASHILTLALVDVESAGSRARQGLTARASNSRHFRRTGILSRRCLSSAVYYSDTSRLAKRFCGPDKRQHKSNRPQDYGDRQRQHNPEFPVACESRLPASLNVMSDIHIQVRRRKESRSELRH